MSGLFITLEGPDGCGKSTQVAPLADYLRAKGRTVFTTREPGGTEISDQVRQIIMAMKNTSMHPRTETAAIPFRARTTGGRSHPPHNWLPERLSFPTAMPIQPWLTRGTDTVYDRDVIRRLLEFATGGLKPDLTLLLDVDAEEGLRRRQTGGGEWNRLDAYQLEFHRRVRDGYHELAALEPARWVSMDAAQKPEMVQLAIRRVVDDRVK